MKKGDRIAQLIIEKVDNQDLQEVAHLDDSKRVDQGVGNSNTSMNQSIKGQEAKPHLEINEISARVFRKFYQLGEMTGLLRWDEVNNEIAPEAINMSTDLAIQNKRDNEDQDVQDTDPQEYHHLLNVFDQ